LYVKLELRGDDEQRLEMRQRRDDVLHYPVGKVFLFRIAAHVLKREHGDGRLVGGREDLRLAHSQT
jgi:hypothetical protein